MGDPADERIHRAGAAGRTDKMIGNARRIRSGHIQRKNYFYFGVQKRLWAFLNPIFTGGFSINEKPPKVSLRRSFV
jgi:hypothetical protein